MNSPSRSSLPTMVRPMHVPRIPPADPHSLMPAAQALCLLSFSSSSLRSVIRKKVSTESLSFAAPQQVPCTAIVPHVPAAAAQTVSLSALSVPPTFPWHVSSQYFIHPVAQLDKVKSELLADL